MCDVGVLAGLEFERLRLHRLQPKRNDVTCHRLQRGHRGADVLDGHAAEQLILVEVQQFNRAVAEGMRAAQQHVTLVHLRVVAGERRVVLHLDVAVEDIGFARRATAFPTAVHQMNTLPERGVEDVLLLAEFHLDVDGLEVDAVRVSHGNLLRAAG